MHPNANSDPVPTAVLACQTKPNPLSRKTPKILKPCFWRRKLKPYSLNPTPLNAPRFRPYFLACHRKPGAENAALAAGVGPLQRVSGCVGLGGKNHRRWQQPPQYPGRRSQPGTLVNSYFILCFQPGSLFDAGDSSQVLPFIERVLIWFWRIYTTFHFFSFYTGVLLVCLENFGVVCPRPVSRAPARPQQSAPLGCLSLALARLR